MHDTRPGVFALLLGLVLGGIGGPAAAVDSTTPCADVFSSAATSHVRNTKIDFKRNAQLLNTPTPVLGFIIAQKDKKSTAPTCGIEDCSAGGPLGATLDPGAFQDSTSNVNFDAPADGDTLTAPAYKDVTVATDSTLTLDPAISEYFIDTLEVDDNGVVVLPPGDYWIHDLTLKQGAQIVTAGTGTARIYAEKVKFEKEVLVNSPEAGVSGDPSQLFLYVYDDDVKLEDASTFSGFIYGGKKIETEEGVTIFGGISAAKNVTLKDESTVTYSPDAIPDADFGCLCSCAPADLLDHFRIGAAVVGVTCEPQTATVTAVRTDGGVYDLYAGTIDLQTSTGLGDWTLIAGSGVLTPGAPGSGAATYVFDGADQGQVTLGLRHAVEAAVNIDVSNEEGITELSNNAPPEDPTIEMRTAALRFYADGVADAIGTQISGKTSSLAPGAQQVTLRAVVAGADPSVCESRLAPGSHPIALGYRCMAPDTCVLADALSVNGSSVPGSDLGAPAGFTTVDLNFVANGTVIEAPLEIAFSDAGAISLHAASDLPEDAAGPAVTLTGSSSTFVVRPFTLGFDNIRSGAVTNPGGTASAGAGFTAAGAPFRFDLAGYRYQAGDDLDADGALDPGADPTDNGITPAFAAPVDLSLQAISPAGGAAGALGPAAVPAGAFSGGVAAVDPITYSEVGSAILAALSNDYLGAPDADVSGFSPEIGRFYPDGFDMLLDVVTPGCNIGSFTYMGQPALGISYRLLARNVAGTTTLNYDADLGYTTGQVRYHAENTDDGVDRGARLITTPGAWRQGSHVYPGGAASYGVSDAVFARVAAPDGPYPSLRIGLSVTADPDGRTVAAPDMDPDTTGDCAVAGTCSAIGLSPVTALRFGRVRVVDAYGPETLDLPVPLLAEYFDGASFVRNVDDGDGTGICTRLPLTTVDLQSGSTPGTPIPLGSGTTTGTLGYTGGPDYFFATGDAGLGFSAPGAGNTGRITIDLDLAAHPWLRFDWDADGAHDDDPPQATAIFGRYRGHDRIIYWSEQR